MTLKLYHYWRSSSSWRVRWGLILKNLSFDLEAVNLLDDAQNAPAHLTHNASGQVPVLEIQDGATTTWLSESTAILEWLEETHPTPSLLPQSPWERAQVRELCQMINAGTQPIQNLKVLKKISDDQNERQKWAVHWIEKGFTAYEKKIRASSGLYSFGNTITMADLFLVPQCYNADRFGLDWAPFPLIKKINERCLQTEACQKAAPDQYKPI